jgi:hypothetical protein
MIIFNNGYPDCVNNPDYPDYSNFFIILNFLILLVLTSTVSFLKFNNLILYTLLKSKSNFNNLDVRIITFDHNFTHFAIFDNFD